MNNGCWRCRYMRQHQENQVEVRMQRGTEDALAQQIPAPAIQSTRRRLLLLVGFWCCCCCWNSSFKYLNKNAVQMQSASRFKNHLMREWTAMATAATTVPCLYFWWLRLSALCVFMLLKQTHATKLSPLSKHIRHRSYRLVDFFLVALIFSSCKFHLLAFDDKSSVLFARCAV